MGGRKMFIQITNHCWDCSKRMGSMRVQNFLLNVAEFSLNPNHIEGKYNVLADLGSRNIPSKDDENMVLLAFCAEDHEMWGKFQSRKYGGSYPH